jgi:hypothetical protein
MIKSDCGANKTRKGVREMDEKQIAAILVNATATVYAAKLQRAEKDGVNPHDLKFGLCGVDVFTAWRDMIKNVHNVIASETPPKPPEIM